MALVWALFYVMFYVAFSAPYIISEFLRLDAGAFSIPMIGSQVAILVGYYALASLVVAGTVMSFVICAQRRMLWLPLAAIFTIWLFFFDGWLMLLIYYSLVFLSLGCALAISGTLTPSSSSTARYAQPEKVV